MPLNGHSCEDWEASIGQAVTAAQEHHRLHPPELPGYSSRRRYRKNWWKDDYAGKAVDGIVSSPLVRDS